MQKNVLKRLFTSHKRDLLLGAGLLLTALCLFFVFKYMLPRSGTTVTVKFQSKTEVFLIQENLTKQYSGFYGSNTLVIKDGKVSVVEASCKDHICEKMGEISKFGEMIICLPNEFFVTITSGEEGDVDAIAQ